MLHILYTYMDHDHSKMLHRQWDTTSNRHRSLLLALNQREPGQPCHTDPFVLSTLYLLCRHVSISINADWSCLVFIPTKTCGWIFKYFQENGCSILMLFGTTVHLYGSSRHKHWALITIQAHTRPCKTLKSRTFSKTILDGDVMAMSLRSLSSYEFQYCQYTMPAATFLYK